MERLSILICGVLLFGIPSSLLASGGKDINVGTIYFADGTSQSTATLQGPAGPQGKAGANGYNSLVSITDETSGSNCAYGGTKIQVGLDQDRSGVLDFSEVVQTKYICNGTSSVAPGTISVTASPSPQKVNSFVNITATASNSGQFGGIVYFKASGPFCKLYNPDSNDYSEFASQYVTAGGTASVALTSSTVDPCIVYADYSYYDYSTNTSINLSGSALATFVPDNGSPAVPPPPPITVTASPSTQTINSFVNITATVTGQPWGTVYFETVGTFCKLYNPDTNSYSNWGSQSVTPGGTASIALTSSTADPCIVYAGFRYYDGSTNTEVNLSGSALATFLSPQN